MAGKRVKILFLCTGNSCRSQMAEGWANHLFPEQVKAYSAGTRPYPVHPLAAKAMAEAGVDISPHRSKDLPPVQGVTFDLVITLCDSAKEECPLLPGTHRLIHRGFSDPAQVLGNQEERLESFRQVREEIKEFVQEVIEAHLQKDI